MCRIKMVPAKAKRISITLPEDLFTELEETTFSVGYKKRSQAIADAVRRFVLDYRLLHQIKVGECAGTITFTYKHNIRGLSETLTKIQHKYSEIINASLHIHLDEDTCLETLTVRGEIEKVKELIKKLETIKTENVQHVILPRLK